MTTTTAYKKRRQEYDLARKANPITYKPKKEKDLAANMPAYRLEKRRGWRMKRSAKAIGDEAMEAEGDLLIAQAEKEKLAAIAETAAGARIQKKAERAATPKHERVRAIVEKYAAAWKDWTWQQIKGRAGAYRWKAVKRHDEEFVAAMDTLIERADAAKEAASFAALCARAERWAKEAAQQEAKRAARWAEQEKKKEAARAAREEERAAKQEAEHAVCMLEHDARISALEADAQELEARICTRSKKASAAAKYEDAEGFKLGKRISERFFQATEKKIQARKQAGKQAPAPKIKKKTGKKRPKKKTGKKVRGQCPNHWAGTHWHHGTNFSTSALEALYFVTLSYRLNSTTILSPSLSLKLKVSLLTAHCSLLSPSKSEHFLDTNEISAHTRPP